MKKNLPMRIASVVLVALLMTTHIISGTFAKYTAEATGSDTAEIAKWSFTVGGSEIAGTTTKSFTFDLFNTIKDTNGGANETHISTTGNTKIAPGTQGSFALVLNNASDVTANYKITLTQTKAGSIVVPIEYSADNGQTWTTAANLANFKVQADLGIGNSITKTIQWRWAIGDNNNTTDTTLGLGNNGAKYTITVTAKVDVEQVD